MGNSFGQLFRITTWGESHGGGVGVVIDGCPPRIGTGARSFLTSTRTAVGMIDFSTAAVGPFAFINAAIPPSPATVGLPVLSHDGLEFTFSVGGTTDTTISGIYDSVRATTNATFPAATELTGAVQTFDGITGLSSDTFATPSPPGAGRAYGFRTH